MNDGAMVLLAPGVVRADERLLRLITGRMAERGLSMRSLARAARVSHSSLSRLLSGRARATPGLLRAVAPVLGLPADELLGAAGLAAEDAGDVLEALRGLGLDPAPPELVGRVRDELARLGEYAGTGEARALARHGLERKLEALGARGPVAERLQALGRLYLADATAPEEARLAAGGAVLYFLQAVDAIDDFMWPIGYLDDAVAVALAEAEVRRVMGESWEGGGPPPGAPPSGDRPRTGSDPP
jgi:transcriptional regulator with XRE-family HTH domain